MTKFNSGKASILVITSALFVASFLLGKTLTSVSADDHGDNDHHTQYCHPDEGHYPFTLSDSNSHDSFVYSGTCEKGDGRGAEDEFKQCISDWCSNNQPHDECSNIDGLQTEIPKGYVRGEGNTCNEETSQPVYGCMDESATNYDPKATDPGDVVCTFSSPTPDPDVCANIDGVQTSVPDGMHLDASGKNCVNFSGSGPAPRNDEGNGTGGQVLGASTTRGQVLGASTMAGTGSFEEMTYQAIMVIGATLSAFGIKGLKKSKKAI